MMDDRAPPLAYGTSSADGNPSTSGTRERLVTLTADQTVDEARVVFDSHGLKWVPVIDADTGRFQGSLKLNDLVKANQSGKKDDKLRGMI